jgi:hypothetical protein
MIGGKPLVGLWEMEPADLGGERVRLGHERPRRGGHLKRAARAAMTQVRRPWAASATPWSIPMAVHSNCWSMVPT